MKKTYHYTLFALGTVGVYSPLVASGFCESEKNLEEVKAMIGQHHIKQGHNYDVHVSEAKGVILSGKRGIN